MSSSLIRLFREEQGQDLIEYALLSALLAVACITGILELTRIIEFFAALGMLSTTPYEKDCSPERFQCGRGPADSLGGHAGRDTATPAAMTRARISSSTGSSVRW